MVLKADQLFRALLVRDVTSDAAVAGKTPVAVAHRLAAHADEAPCAIRARAPHHYVVERLARIEQGAVRVPAAFDFEPTLPALLPQEPLLHLLQLRVAA